MNTDIISFGGKEIFLEHVVFFEIVRLEKSNWMIRVESITEDFFAEEYIKEDSDLLANIEAIVKREKLTEMLRLSCPIVYFSNFIVVTQHVVLFLIEFINDKWKLTIFLVNGAQISNSFNSCSEAVKEKERIIEEGEIYDIISFDSFAFARDKIVAMKVTETPNEKILNLDLIGGAKQEVIFESEELFNDIYNYIVDFCYDEEESDEQFDDSNQEDSKPDC